MAGGDNGMMLGGVYAVNDRLWRLLRIFTCRRAEGSVVTLTFRVVGLPTDADAPASIGTLAIGTSLDDYVVTDIDQSVEIEDTTVKHGCQVILKDVLSAQAEQAHARQIRDVLEKMQQVLGQDV